MVKENRKNCVEFPVWRYDQQLLDTGVRGKVAFELPPGPNSPVGILWAGLSHPGIGMQQLPGQAAAHQADHDPAPAMDRPEHPAARRGRR